MAGALDFLTVQGPRPASYTPPAIDSSWAGNLVDDYQKGQQYGYQRNLQTLFRPGTPGADALARGDTGQLFQLLAGAGGAPVVQGLLPQMLGAQSTQQIMQGLGGGGQLGALGQPAGGQQAAVPTGGADPRGKIPVIIAAAQKYGVDPATAIKVARSEGLASFYGDNGRSGTAFQLYTAGGLGNEFQKETGLNPLDPKNEDAAIDWAMRNVARTGWGPYKGAAKVGVGNRQGIGTPPSSRTASTSPGTEQETTQGPTPGTAAAESPQPEQRAAVVQPDGAIGQAPFMPPAGQGTNAAGPGNITGGAQRPAQAPAQPQAQPQPPPQQIAQAPAAPPAQAVPPGMDLADAQRERTRQANLEKASATAAANPFAPKDLSERLQNDANKAGERAQKIEDFHAERAKQEYGVGIAQRTEEAKKDVETYSKEYDETQKKGDEAARATQTLHLAKAFLNDPTFDSGTFSGNKLAYKRFMTAIGKGDDTAALTQEGFRKATSEAILEQLRSLGGQGIGPVKAKEFETITKAAQNEENTPATNRLLTEMGLRLAERWQIPLAQQAREYRASHGGHLDAGWDAQKAAYVERTPLFSPDELEHTQRIAPIEARTPQEAKAKGWHEGEYLRVPDPRTGGTRIITHLGPGQ